MNGALSVRAAALESPAGPALVHGGREIGWMDLARRVERRREALRRRLARTMTAARESWASTGPAPPGAPAPVVGVVGGAGLQTVVTLLALLEHRAAFVLLHPRWTRGERDRALVLAGARLWIESDGGFAATRAAVGRGQSTVGRGAAVVFTSGTTGQPRGAVLGRAALAASARAHKRALGWQENDRWLLSLPTAHVGGLMIVIRCLEARRTVVLSDGEGAGRFDAADTLRVVERDRVTILSVVPTMLARLLRATRRPPRCVRAVLVGGAAAPAPLMEQARLRGWPVLSTYGLTEACSQVATQRFGAPVGAGCAPLPGVEVRVASPTGSAGPDLVRASDEGAFRQRARGVHGAIQIRGRSLFEGYLGAEPGAPLQRPFEQGGWFDTGDLGELDRDGDLHVVGRRQDRIVTGGENVDPAEVEAAVVEWPGAAEACVVGLENDEWGEQVGAVLVPTAGFEQLGGLAGLKRRLSSRLAGFKRPRCWSVVDRLPVAASGKVDRSACARLLAESPGSCTEAGGP